MSLGKRRVSLGMRNDVACLTASRAFGSSGSGRKFIANDLSFVTAILDVDYEIMTRKHSPKPEFRPLRQADTLILFLRVKSGTCRRFQNVDREVSGEREEHQVAVSCFPSCGTQTNSHRGLTRLRHEDFLLSPAQLLKRAPCLDLHELTNKGTVTLVEEHTKAMPTPVSSPHPHCQP